MKKDTRKPAAIITFLKRDNKGLRERNTAYIIASDQYRARATKAEQEAAEWKHRFDQLLAACRASAMAVGPSESGLIPATQAGKLREARP